MAIPEQLRRDAEAWTRDDPDPETRAEIARLLEEEDGDGLSERFAGSLEFGTAGLRGLLGAGPNRMNRKVVLRATAGLCAHLLETCEDARARGVCIGFDGRRMSRELARDAASVAAGMGLKVRAFDRVTPTPLVAFACLRTEAAAGIVVTASHNPPEYNGYKVYWGNGAQIVPPVDAGIAAAIEAVGDVDDIARADFDEAVRDGRIELLGDALEAAYLEGVRALQVHPGLPRDVSIAYTAMHGVGERFVMEALRQAGFTRVHSVPEQAEPDGSFPTVSFPNPEEDGAMDLVLALAEEERADVVFANDPDADRLAVAVRDTDGAYVQLTGNEVGSLLGHYLLDQGPAGDARLVVNTIVSSPMLGAIAAAHGARWEQTLTGFKWIANRAMALEAEEDARFVFGYEEALGYTVGQLVRDKDGIGTAVVVADMAAWCRSRGKTLIDELEEAWRRYGMYLSRQVSRVHPGTEGAEKIAAVMARVREAPPSSVGERAVEAFTDLSSGVRRGAGGVTTSPLPRGDVLSLELEGGHRVMLRPSGTEPKIKLYLDVRVDMGGGETVAAAKARGEAVLDALEGWVDEVAPAG
ncbi:MAG TPA: phospho-sugar mutase [Sandaracinaceae bacterium LLY-WYZ-13_1]|nr:phospho-sugar mutase [Sandaracinaceae bacterium LLY-WYZ-13_1]